MGSTRRLHFEKYEGLGNDFLVVESRDENAVTPELAAALCNRKFGVGADGVLLLLPPRSPSCAARMRVLNADGSVPEMCGNGARCVALHIARDRLDLNVLIDTDAGIRACRVELSGGHPVVTVDMGIVRLDGDCELTFDGRKLSVAIADAGNPHAVLFGPFARGDIESLGPRIATDGAFPRGTNVEFAHIDGDGIDLVVWERGVGLTSACGTGACATVAVACEKGLVPRDVPITVRLPGGALAITVDHAGRAMMRGPAKHVFSGEVTVPSE